MKVNFVCAIRLFTVLDKDISPSERDQIVLHAIFIPEEYKVPDKRIWVFKLL